MSEPQQHESQIEDRRAKLAKLRELGVDPYGAKFEGVRAAAAARARAEARGIEPGQIWKDDRWRLAGRVVLHRAFGNLVFLTLRDGSGDIQIGLSKKALKDAWPVIKLLDLGDIIGVAGPLGTTKTSEVTVWADQFVLLAKALQPPPSKWHGLKDVDLRYRRRYVDLFCNPEVRDTFQARSRIIQAIRNLLADKEFLEVETPMLQPQYGGAAARPFVTHHNALDMDLFLRISPELYLKRLLVGGVPRVFEINRNFRNEGISTQHNPEFTMLEAYQAYGDYHDMMDLVEAMFAAAIDALDGKYRRPFGEHQLDYTPPWPRRTYADLLAEHGQVAVNDPAAVRAKATSLGIEHAAMDDAVVTNAVFEATVEDKLIQPTFVLDYPAPLCPLTRRKADDPGVALRFEGYVAGMEIANAYTELNDPAVQRETFSAQLRGEGDETMRVMDEDFVRALEYGMPPAGGLGVGIDRMVMLLTNSMSIRDVILFPLQRPLRGEGGGSATDENDGAAVDEAT
jgi:lysyl-tRNA synthetase class 2